MINRGARRLADCSGQMIWPKRGVYLVQPGAVSLAISTIPTTSTSNLGRDGRNRELARATAIAKGARACDFDGCQKLPLPSEVTRRSEASTACWQVVGPTASLA
jgi:hypothetical protein